MDNLKVIPQLFYDLIARVAPGAVAIYFLTNAINVHSVDFILNSFNGVAVLQDSAITIILVFVGISYVVSFLLSPISNVTVRLARLVRPFSFRTLRDMVTDPVNSKFPTEMINFYQSNTLVASAIAKAEPGVDLLHPLTPLRQDPYLVITGLFETWLYMNDPQRGTVAVKMTAELVLCKIITTAALVSLPLHLIAVLLGFVELNLPLLVGIVIALILGLLAVAAHTRALDIFILRNYFLANQRKVRKRSPMRISTSKSKKVSASVP